LQWAPSCHVGWPSRCSRVLARNQRIPPSDLRGNKEVPWGISLCCLDLVVPKVLRRACFFTHDLDPMK
jgi:hypothetical protein